MTSQAHYFNIHDLFKIKVSGKSKSELNAFVDKFSYFSDANLLQENLSVEIGPFSNTQRATLIAKNFRSGPGWVEVMDRYKIIKWHVYISGLDSSSWRVQVHCTPKIGYEAFLTMVLRPLLCVSLMQHKNLLIHSCGAALGNQSFLFSALPGVGKSSLALSLMAHGFEYHGDENVILDESGSCYAFPISMPITSKYLKQISPQPNLNFRQKLRLLFGNLVQLLSRGFFEKSLNINPSHLFPIQKKQKLSGIFILQRGLKPFKIDRLSSDEAAHLLALINDHELSLLRSYFHSYFLANPTSSIEDWHNQFKSTCHTAIQEIPAYRVHIENGKITENHRNLIGFLSNANTGSS